MKSSYWTGRVSKHFQHSVLSHALEQDLRVTLLPRTRLQESSVANVADTRRRSRSRDVLRVLGRHCILFQYLT